MIDARKLASLRRKAANGPLHDAGYRPSRSQYLAKVGCQLRYINLGPSVTIGWQKEQRRVFEASIALHFDFLPPFAFGVWPGAPIPHEMCAELCAFKRLVRNHSGGQYYEYGHLAESEAIDLLRDVSARAVSGLEEIGLACGGNGQQLLGLISPQVLADDLEVFRRLLRASTIEEQDGLSDSMQIRQLLPGWHPHVAPTAILLAYVARRYARPELVPAYIAVARRAGLEQLHMPYIHDLEGLLESPPPEP
jgi:hypothetical protein